MTTTKRTTRSTLPDPVVREHRSTGHINRLHLRALHLATVKQRGGVA